MVTASFLKSTLPAVFFRPPTSHQKKRFIKFGGSQIEEDNLQKTARFELSSQNNRKHSYPTMLRVLYYVYYVYTTTLIWYIRLIVIFIFYYYHGNRLQSNSFFQFTLVHTRVGDNRNKNYSIQVDFSYFSIHSLKTKHFNVKKILSRNNGTEIRKTDCRLMYEWSVKKSTE